MQILLQNGGKGLKVYMKNIEKCFQRILQILGKPQLFKWKLILETNPPVSQRPYSLALKHVEWVRQELEALEKAAVITRSVSP